MAYKHFFFDLDNTLTESKCIISDDMVKAIKKLKGDIIVISGAEKKQIRKQIKPICSLWRLYILAQSGSDCPYWKVKLVKSQKKEVYNHLTKIKNFFPHYFENGDDDLLQDRGCQLSFSFIGHNADLQKKKAFDRGGLFRKTVLKTIPFESKTLEVKVGGTTCLDYTNKNGTKGRNIDKFIDYKKWNKEECIYFGDALFEGGNDETVIGVIDTMEVSNPLDLINKLKKFI